MLNIQNLFSTDMMLWWKSLPRPCTRDSSQNAGALKIWNTVTWILCIYFSPLLIQSTLYIIHTHLQSPSPKYFWSKDFRWRIYNLYFCVYLLFHNASHYTLTFETKYDAFSESSLIFLCNTTEKNLCCVVLKFYQLCRLSRRAHFRFGLFLYLK